MADKRLIYNDNGTNAEIPDSGSGKAAYFDEGNNTLVVRGLTITKVTASIGSINGILGTNADGKLISISTASATNGQYLQSNGTSWAFRDAAGEASGSYLSPSDLTGSLSAPTVLSIQNVTSGALSALNGGTGVSTFTSGGIFVKDSTSAMKMLRPDAGASVLRPDGSGSWYSGGSTGTASYNVQAQRFTASVNPHTWTKPSTHKNVKIILMGGGGGGAGGRLGLLNGFPSGGGAGGFSVYDMIEAGSLTASVTVGTGGLGGIRSTVPGVNGAIGSQGGDTFFSSSKGHYFMAGGGGGGSQTPAWGNPGFGNISSGFEGRGSADLQDSYWFGGAGSGGGGRGNDNPGVAIEDIGGSGNRYQLLGSLTASGGITGGQGVNGTNGSAVSVAYGAFNYYAAFGGGGGGGGVRPATAGQPAGNGGNGISGSGGGGGGYSSNISNNAGNGGDGGNGYAIIISW